MKKIVILHVLVFLLTVSAPLSGLAAPGPDGFFGVPWGADRFHVDEAMAKQGFRLLSSWAAPDVVYDGMLAGIAGELHFKLLSGALFSGMFSMYCKDSSTAAWTTYRKFTSIISSKYGAPTYSQEPRGAYEWDGLQAPDSSDIITIVVLYAETVEPCGGMVSVHYTNESLQQRLAGLKKPTEEVAPPATSSKLPAAGQVFRDCADCPEMVVIAPGEFMMGTGPLETTREGVPHVFAEEEQPLHTVRVGQAFALGKYPVTKGEYARFVEASSYSGNDAGCSWSDRSWRDPGFAQTDRDPVVCVSWNDAKAYVAWLSRATGTAYRLPTEAEWEYAARAGTTTARYWGEAMGSANANCNGCGSQWDNKRTSPVGSFRPNAFGLYDMLGDAAQWVEDCWAENYYGAPSDAGYGAPNNTSIALASGDCGHRVQRGGSWGYVPRAVRAGSRGFDVTGFRSVYTGFRVARTE